MIGRRDKSVRLAAMVGLMVEHMDENFRQRLLETIAAHIGVLKGAGERCAIKSVDERNKADVLGFARCS